jgi:hypothetical protein
MPALKKLETVIPARMIVVLELSESAARKKISSVVILLVLIVAIVPQR